MNKRILTHNERIVLRKIDSATVNAPVLLTELMQLLKCGDRYVKGIIEQLRRKGACIVSIRSKKLGKRTGYFIPRTETERQEGMAPFIKQIQSEIEIKEIMLNADLNAHKQLLEDKDEHS